jgi:hypothetical protein
MTATVSLPGQTTDEDRMPYLDRLRVRLHRHRLDLRLAAGEDPSSDPELRRRAGELTARKKRVRVAAVLDRVTVEAEGPAGPFSSNAPLARGAICACTDEGQALIDRLTGPGPVAPRGVAMAALLVRGGGGPLYSATTAAEELRGQLTEIVAALD